MGGYADKLQNKAGEVLRPGEQLLSAIRAQPRGSTTGMAVGGLVGGAIAGRQASKAQAGAAEGSVAKSWPQGKFALGLTDQRLLAFNYTALGKPKDLTGEFPLDQVASVDVDKKMVANSVRFSFTDGSSIEVECPKLEKVGDFVAAFQKIKTGA
ncbi:MAG: PH domain-containing protein [Actinomycetota bacterium]